MNSTYAPINYHQPWPTTEHHHELHWTPYDPSPRMTGLNVSRSSSLQPMQRYLREKDRPFAASGYINTDPAMQPFPETPMHALHYVDNDGTIYPLPPRHLSPSNSALSASHVSSSVSDREQTPWSSPHVQPAIYTPPSVYTETSLHANGGYGSIGDPHSHGSGQCISMHVIQQYPDEQCDAITCDDEPAAYTTVAYGSYAQEGYHPMHQENNDAVPIVPSQMYEPETPDSIDSDEVKPVIRKRRPQATRTVTSPRQASKVTKRPSTGKRSSTYHSRGSSKDDTTSNATSARAFPCPFTPYGCTSTFGSKNEWKRHVSTQHMRLGFWRCDQCAGGERKPNDFNRKDLFIQHVRRMHPVPTDDKKSATKARSKPPRRNSEAEDEMLGQIATRCYRRTRSPPSQSGCMFCEQTFEGPKTWDERMEHIGRHMEAGKKGENGAASAETWQTDQITEDWLLKEGLIKRQHGRLMLAQ